MSLGNHGHWKEGGKTLKKLSIVRQILGIRDPALGRSAIYANNKVPS